jgi:hypothetical protein
LAVVRLAVAESPVDSLVIMVIMVIESKVSMGSKNDHNYYNLL